MLRSSAPALAVLSLCLLSSAVVAEGRLLNRNPGFERGLADWQVYVAPRIAATATVRAERGANARHGAGYLRLRLPREAQDNQRDYVRVGQRVPLAAGTLYRYRASVRWNNPGNRLPSAIVSAWVRYADGSYAGVDRWLEDARGADGGWPDARRGYRTIDFLFSPSRDGVAEAYVSLLTHQDGNLDATEVLVDAFRVEEIGPLGVDPDGREGNLLVDGGFDGGRGARPGPDWLVTESNPLGVAELDARLVGEGPARRLRLALPAAGSPDRLNGTWSGLYQNVVLHRGVRYRLSLAVDRRLPDGNAPSILNVFAYKGFGETPETWLGPVDYKFTRTDRHPYCAELAPIETAVYQVTTRLFGWGNEGRQIELDVDDLALEIGTCPR